MLRHYIKMAMRHLLKNKIQNLISIVGLSVGILCFTEVSQVNKYQLACL